MWSLPDGMAIGYIPYTPNRRSSISALSGTRKAGTSSSAQSSIVAFSPVTAAQTTTMSNSDIRSTATRAMIPKILARNPAMPPEIPPIKGKEDGQCRQWQQDDGVRHYCPRGEEDRGDLHHERKGGHAPGMVFWQRVLPEHMKLQILGPLVVQLGEQKERRGENQRLDIGRKNPNIWQQAQRDGSQTDQQAGV